MSLEWERQGDESPESTSAIGDKSLLCTEDSSTADVFGWVSIPDVLAAVGRSGEDSFEGIMRLWGGNVGVCFSADMDVRSLGGDARGRFGTGGIGCKLEGVVGSLFRAGWSECLLGGLVRCFFSVGENECLFGGDAESLIGARGSECLLRGGVVGFFCDEGCWGLRQCWDGDFFERRKCFLASRIGLGVLVGLRL